MEWRRKIIIVHVNVLIKSISVFDEVDSSYLCALVRGFICFYWTEFTGVCVLMDDFLISSLLQLSL